MKKPEIHIFSIKKGAMGFGFTIADSAYGQKVKKILDRNCCTQLQEGDVLLEINALNVRNKSHVEVVQVLKDCSNTEPTMVKIQRVPGAGGGTSPSAYHSTTNGGNVNVSGNVAKLRKNFISSTGLFRSKTPTADLYSTQQKEILPIRPKTPLVDTRRARVRTPDNELNTDAEVAAATTNGSSSALERSLAESKSQIDGKSSNSLQELEALHQNIPFMDPYPKLVTSLSERLAEATLLSDAELAKGEAAAAASAAARANYENQEYVTASNHSGSYNPIYGLSQMPPTMSPLNSVHQAQYLTSPHSAAPQLYTSATPLSLLAATSNFHHESCHCYDCQDYRGNRLRNQLQLQQQQQQHPLNYYGHQLTTPSFTPLSHHHPQYSPATLHANTPLQAAHIQNERMQKRVNELLSDRRKVGFSPLDTQQHGHNVNSAYVAPQPQQQQQQQQHGHNVNSAYVAPQQQQQQHSPAVSSISQQPSVAWTGYNTYQPTTLSAVGAAALAALDDPEQYELTEVTLERQALGFGFRIVGGTEEGSQVAVGHIVPGGAADNGHRIATGDEILSIDGVNVVNSSHHKVVSLMGEAALRGQVTMILRRRPLAYLQTPLQQQLHQHPAQQQQQHTLRPTQPRCYPYDVIVSRHENEGFGFVIISSSTQYYGSAIGKLIPGSPADRCGELKVGDRIIAVNRIDIAGMSHGDVVNLVKESGLHVRLTIGCPKEGMLNTSAQASPVSIVIAPQTPQMTATQNTANLTQASMSQQQQQQQQQQRQQSDMSAYGGFERPSTSHASIQQAQQQQPQQQHLPPQL